MSYQFKRFELKFRIDTKTSSIPYTTEKDLFKAFIYWQSKGARRLRCYEILTSDITQDIEEAANNDRR